MKLKPMFLVAVMLLIVSYPVMAQHVEGQSSIGIFGNAKKLVGDNTDWDIVSPSIGMKLGYTVKPAWTFTLNGWYSVTYPKNPDKTGLSKYYTKMPNTPFKTILMPIIADVQLNYRPNACLNPYLTWGMGILFWELKNNGASVYDKETNGLFDVGLGLECFIKDYAALDFSVHYERILFQKLDMAGYDDKQTGILEARAGLNFFFGGNRDTDKDGIFDRLDKCPKQAEDMDGFQDMDGCPDLDNDGDGIADINDKAPNLAEDKDGFQDEDGAPDIDNDGDGIADINDKAPNLAEDKDGFQDDDGAPDLDNDADGIQDLKDKCPDKPETVNGFEDADGCPDTKPEVVIEKDAPIILEGVNFETASATLTLGAKEVLDKVQRTLVEYPQMILEVRGYTDNKGSRAANVKLSQRRADAVKAYLTSKGIAATRIQTKGFGPDNPVAPNTTPEGRLKNRRIEFIRLD